MFIRGIGSLRAWRQAVFPGFFRDGLAGVETLLPTDEGNLISKWNSFSIDVGCIVGFHLLCNRGYSRANFLLF